MKNILFLLFLFSCFSSSFAQMTQDWLKSYGLNGISTNIFYSVKVTRENEIVAVGKFYSDLNHSVNFFVTKFDKNGNEVWTRESNDSLYEQARVIIEDNHGDFLIGGSRSDFALLLKLNSSGDIIWEKEINLFPYNIEQIRDLKQMDDSSYVMVGVADGDMMNHTDKIWVIKTDYNGNTIWSKTYSSGIANSISITKQNKLLILSGRKVLKIDSSGEKIWEKTYKADYLFSIKKTNNNSFILTGSVSDCCYKDISIIKIDELGNLIWEKRYGGEGEEIGYDVSELKDGSLFILAKAPPGKKIGQSQIWLLKIDNMGDTLWTRKFAVSKYDFSYAYPQSFFLEDSKNPIIVGTATDSANVTIRFILKLSSNTTDSENNRFAKDHIGYSLKQNYPNPFNPATIIQYSVPKLEEAIVTLKVYDVLGTKVATLVNAYKRSGNYKITFDTRNLSSGIYFYTLRSNKFVETKKMLLLK